MIFLNPAILFGLLAASIPILIHLLNLRKLKKIEFSTLVFLKELQKTKVRKIKLKQWILLALRVLIVLLIVSAFARPTIKSVSIGGAASTAKTTSVIIIDDTYSMSIISDKGSYFNQAKLTAKSIVDEFQEGDEISILTLSNNSDLPLTTNKNLVVNFINDLEISELPGTIINSVNSAWEVLNNSNNFNKEIYILGDFQKSEFEEINNNEKIDLQNSDGIKLFAFKFGDENAANLAVTDFTINNQIFEKGKLINLSANVKNTSTKSFKNTIISLFVNGNRSAQQSVNLNAGENKTVNFETNLLETGNLEMFVELEDDDILTDNRRYLSLEIPSKIKTTIFYDNIQDTKFLELALKGNNNNNIEISKYNLNRISSVNLEDNNLVIIVGSKNINSYKRLVEFVNNGGNVILFPGSSSEISDFKNLCSELNLPNPTSIIDNKSDSNIGFEFVDFQHPIFFNLFENKSKKEIDSPNIYSYIKFQNNINGKKIITLADKSSFLTEFNFNESKILLFNSAPSIGWSNFILKGIFPPIINKSVFYLSSRINEINTYLTGDEINISTKKIKIPQIEIVKPSGKEELLSLENLGIANFVSYDKNNKAGSYKFLSNKIQQKIVSVNVNTIGSELEFISNNNFEEYLKELNFTGSVFNISPNEDFSSAIYQSRFGSELWRYFLLIALLLALIEMTIAKSAKKDLAGISK